MNASGARDKLVKAARKAFAARGYAAVSVDDVAAAAKLTKGAVYYQFTDKADLFRAACADALEEIAARVTQATMGEVAHVADEIVTGGDILFDIYEEEEMRRLLIEEALAVLGPAGWAELHEPLRVGLAEHALTHVADEGLIPRRMIPMMAHLLFGAFSQGVLQIAAAEDRAAARKQARAAYKRLAQGLLVKV